MQNLWTGTDSKRNPESASDVDTPPEQSVSIDDLRRWASVIMIVAYLCFIGHGLFCHAVQYRVNAHPIMYFTVWDMFCGWSGWSFRTHVVAEGASGALYELTPTPWTAYRPFSTLGREHYDYHGHHASRIGVNCLRQTEHEPIVRMFVVEETWSKKFNLPDSLWSRIHEEPRRSHHYFNVNTIHHPDGQLMARHPSFLDRQRTTWLASSLQGRKGQEHVQMTVTSPFTN